MVKKSNNQYFYAVGRRRSAVASVKLFLGQETNTVNKLTFDKYFPSQIEKVLLDKVFAISNTNGKYCFKAKVVGGGKNSQLDALILAIARALIKNEPDLQKTLKDNGFLTVDSRVRERRKIGRGGKARRRKQSPKR